MSDAITRYAIKPWDAYTAYPVRATDGEFVRYDDHVAEIERLKKRIAAHEALSDALEEA
jgi:hypothetical protein